MANNIESSSSDSQIMIGQDKANDESYANEYETLECPVCLQLCVHPTKLPVCGHIFCFLCVKGLKNRRCAMCRAEFPNEFLEHPQLLLPLTVTPSTSISESNEYQWFYKGHNGWWQYDERTCLEIEEAYKKAQKQCTILVAGNLYIVDFDQMLQKRQTDPSRKRQVKRDLASVPKKGVAGLRLWNADDLTQTSDSADAHNSNSNLVATIAATEAAIQIASDIIDSTLAHADDHTEHQSENRRNSISPDAAGGSVSSGNMTASDQYNVIPLTSNNQNNNSNNCSSSYNRRDMLDEIEATFNITNLSSINNSFRSSSQLDDLFSLTLDEFKNLALNNIADDSSDDNNEDDEAVHFDDETNQFVENPSNSRH